MKFLVYLMILMIAAIAGYIFQPSLYKYGEQLRPVKKIIVMTEEQKKTKAAIEAAQPKHSTADTQKLLDRLREPTPENTGTPTTASTETHNPAAGDDEIDRKYPMPVLRSIQDITKGWTSVPSRAFPRKVKSKVPIDFQVAAGKTTLPADSDLMAFSLEGGMMTVGRSVEDTIRVTVPLASTDFEETMTRLYTAYVDKRKGDVLKARENARYLRDHPAPPPPPADQQVKLAGAKPEMDGDGKFPLMTASILAKAVTEFKLGDVQSWGPLEFEMEGAKGFWTCTVVVKMSTMFGQVDVDVTAFMSGGKVVKWIYAGSKEPVQ